MPSIIDEALKEDIGQGDITTKFLIPKKLKAEAVIIAKENGIVFGLKIAKECFKKLDRKIRFDFVKRDGDKIKPKDIVAKLYGNARAILSAERTALNFLQRLSGIATKTYQYVQKVKGTKAKILDTRKTTPLLRSLEKQAVVAGGGKNHRFGLYDAVLIKDNHLVVEPNISKAIQKAKKSGKKVEIEVKNLEELKQAVLSNADIVLLDNMGAKTIKRAVKIAKKLSKRVLLEASGGVTLKNVKKIAKTGVDFISIGALTHSPKAIDFSLEILKCH